MAFQSLYRRFRPQRFGEVIGQPHLVSALRNAVTEDRVGHAYLLSGPRGTGKTSTARILAKALNCEALEADGEPCGACQSCTSIEAGTSMDLVELDAASNNRVENIRELTANAALGSPGRRKVYLLDEVHMLSTAASNALLKTLEEPPGHVVFILATTDPQKVLPTIRSRTQHVELNLVGAEELEAHVRLVAERADLTLDDAAVEYVVTRGTGSVRDTLSALDQVVAAGGIPNDRVSVDELIAALSQRDLTASLTAVSAAVGAGVDPRDLAERCARRLRDMFLIAANVDPGQLPAAEIAALTEAGRAMGRPTNVRALELIGAALVDMRQAPDPRLTFEVALVRLFADPASPPSSADVGGPELMQLRARIEALEARGVGPADTAEVSPPAEPAELPGSSDLASAVAATLGPAPEADSGAGDAARPPRGPAAAARAVLADASGGAPRPPSAQPAPPASAIPPPPPPPPPMGRSAQPAPPPATAPEVAPAPEAPAEVAGPESAPLPPAAAPMPPSAPAAPIAVDDTPAAPAAPPETALESPGAEADPSLADTQDAAAGDLSHALVVEQWPEVLARMAVRARARFGAAEFVEVEGATAVFQLPNDVHRARCEELRVEVEGVFEEVVGRPVPLRLIADTEPDRHDPSALRAGGGGASGPASEEIIDLDHLHDAPPDGRSTVQRITDAFPGATVIDNDGTM